VFRGVSVLLAPARSAYFFLLNPSSTKRRINSATLMPVLFDALFSLLICIGVSQIVVRFMVSRVCLNAIRTSSTILRCPDLNRRVDVEPPILTVSLGALIDLLKSRPYTLSMIA